MRYCKLQIACFIIVWYVIFIYIQDRKQYKDDSKDYFLKLLVKWDGSGYPTGKKQTKYHFVQELWQLQMYLMHYLPVDVIKSQCH